MEKDRAEERSRREARWERDKSHFSGSKEEYLSMYEEIYRIESHRLEDLGDRDESSLEYGEDYGGGW